MRIRLMQTAKLYRNHNIEQINSRLKTSWYV